MSELIVYTFFKSEEANKNFNFWINQYPESFHPLDLQRFTNMVISILDNDENLEYTHLQQPKSRLKDYQIDSYMDKYASMKDIYTELSNRWNSNK